MHYSLVFRNWLAVEVILGLKGTQADIGSEVRMENLVTLSEDHVLNVRWIFQRVLMGLDQTCFGQNDNTRLITLTQPKKDFGLGKFKL